MQLGIDDLPLRYSRVPVIVLDDSQILYSIRITADDPDLSIFHEQLTEFSLQAGSRSNAKYQEDYAASIQGRYCYGLTS